MSSDPRMVPTLVRKSSLHEPQFATMVNLRGITNDAEPAIRSPLEYIAGQSSQAHELGISSEALKILKRIASTIGPEMPEELRHKILEGAAGTKLPKTIFNALLEEDSGNKEFLAELCLSDQIAKSLALDIVETRAALSHESTTTISRLNNQQIAKQAKRLGIQDIAYMESFPLMVAAVGYKRFPSKEDSKMLLFNGETSRKPIFVETFETESLIITLDPQKVLRFVKQRFPEYNPNPSLPLGIQLSAMAAVFFENHPFDERIEPSPGKLVWTLLHTLSHTFIKAVAGPSGFSINSFSEYLLPGTLSLAIYVNRNQETGIGGLESVFADSLGQLLEGIRDSMSDCLHDPVCWDQKMSRCHACLIISETSCRAYNAHLDRHLVYSHNSTPGFW